MLGHELRNPLAPLSTGLELLQRAGNKPELVDSVHGVLRRQVTHLARLVDDLLDLSRITRGTIELRRTELDVRTAIEAAAELSQPAIDRHGHTLVLEPAAAPLFVEGDAERLTQVIANIIGNGAKYMNAGGVIRVRSEREDGCAVVRIRDEGFGIPADQLERVFDMFSQVPEHRERGGSAGGLGIGLALSRRLVELHGGSIVAESEGRDRGSEFVIRLPLASSSR